MLQSTILDYKNSCQVRQNLRFISSSPVNGLAWEARLRHIYLAGSVAHLDLYVASLDLSLEADVASEDLSRLGLQAGMELRVAPRGAVLFPLDRDGRPLSAERWIWQARSPVPA